MTLSKEIYEANAELYRDKYNEDIESFSSPVSLNIELSRSGYPIARAANRYLFSAYDPFREAEINTKKEDFSKFDVVILYGLGYEVYKIYEVLKPQAFLLVIENSAEIIKMHFYNKEFRALVEDDRVYILYAESIEKLKKFLGFGLLSVTPVDEIKVFSSRNLYRFFYDEFYKEASEIVLDNLYNSFANYNTVLRFSDDWPRNLIYNLKRIYTQVRADKFYNRFKGIPAILVASGPSLDENIDFLKKVQDRALIGVVDTSYRKLIKNGIIPHFVVTVDASELNYKDFEGVPEYTKTFLVAEILTHPLIFEKVKNRIIFYSAGNIFQGIEKSLGYDNAVIPTGGSVANSLFNFFINLGVSDVIFVGQDLCFPGGITHSSDFYKNYFWLDESDYVFTYETQVLREYILVKSGSLEVETNDGSHAFTSKTMDQFRKWYEDAIEKLSKLKSDYHFYNLSGKGAKIKGVKYISHNEALNLLGKKFRLWEKLEGIYEEATHNTSVEPSGFAGFVKELTKELKESLRKAEEMLAYIKKGKHFFRRYEKNRAQLISVYKKMIEIDQWFENAGQASEIVSILASRAKEKLELQLKNLEELETKRQIDLTLKQYHIYYTSVFNSLRELIELIERLYGDLQL